MKRIIRGLDQIEHHFSETNDNAVQLLIAETLCIMGQEMRARHALTIERVEGMKRQHEVALERNPQDLG